MTATIATLSDLASLLKVDVSTLSAYQYDLDLVEGLITEVIGPDVVAAQTSWSFTAKSIALGAVARAYRNRDNPHGLKSWAGDDAALSWFEGGSSLFLTDDEIARLRGTIGVESTGPVGDFPDAFTWPDPPRLVC